MRNLYTCDNCIYNPSQYQDIGSRHGFCLKYNSLLLQASHTTCKFFRRKDLPLFLAEQGHREHARIFAKTNGIVYYYTHFPQEQKNYSEKYVWENNVFDIYVHEVAIYYKISSQKWTYLQGLLASRNPIKNIMHSSLLRGYIQRCGVEIDNYRLMLALSADLGEPIDLRINDFRVEVSYEEFISLRESYLKDIVLLRLYAIQEYGYLIQDENIIWISDELNGAIESSWQEFIMAVQGIVPILQQRITASAQHRGTFFPEQPEKNLSL
ncbi:hypothetical protein [Trichothermofontia sp.]